MNKTYRSVWNESTGTWVAAQENAAGRGKSSRSKAVRNATVSKSVLGAGALAAVGACLVAFAPSAMAGSIENCGNGSNSFDSFFGNPGNGAWGNISTGNVTPADCYAGAANGGGASTSGLVFSEDPNYFNPSSSYATILVGASGSPNSAAGSITLWGPRGISMMGVTNLNNNKIINLAPGTISAASQDGVNGSQLYGLAASTASAFGGNSVVNSDGSISKPTYVVNGNTYNNVGAALTNIGGSVSTINSQITNINGKLNDAVLYDSSAHNSVTLGGTGASTAVALHNVANGALSATSLDAVNGSQLYATNTNVTNLTNTVNNINNGGGIKYFHTNSTLADSSATGSNATAIGPLATASVTSAVAMGNGAVAGGMYAGSVAIGSGATASASTDGSGGAASIAIGQNAQAVQMKGGGAGGNGGDIAIGVNANASGDLRHACSDGCVERRGQREQHGRG